MCSCDQVPSVQVKVTKETRKEKENCGGNEALPTSITEKETRDSKSGGQRFSV